ncbi:cyclase family protein [Microbacterium sp. APC 3898]|uniref:Cyclase family protein n=2 Tax=Planococcus TaxID=1372 RepID=A0ABT7ZNI0_9BACL|nr:MULTISPECIES: cyclase family protein [Terrabacteria group]MBD8016440.1 cyclase family protein [Planococcus wigleyi]MDN3428709.1 cyclase family protein [Planococcus sp. APC 4016]MDN3500170.1 cyclase family protein [Microbacterium sp. APC 3898]
MKPEKIIDISMELSGTTPEWPGDVPFSYELSVTKQESGSVNVGKLQSSTHIGTHIDAPFHYDDQGLQTHELPLDIYLCKAQVMDVSGLNKINLSDLKPLEEGVTAVLLKTASWKNRTAFPETWPVFDVSIAQWLTDNGVNLLGVDVPSVDPETSKELPMHQAMNRHQRFILEGIVLDDVAEGIFRLAALPLKIKGGDGSPVRAVLYS